MLPHLSPCLKPCLRSLSRPLASTSFSVQRRGIFSSLPRRARLIPGPDADPEQEPESEFEEMSSQAEGEREKQPSTYKEFIEKIGNRYQYAQPQQWLAPSTPFPMNPSFKPPPPISDHQKDVIFGKFLADPLVNSPRKLAARYNISLKRMDAILRLKGMERHWLKANHGTPLQTGFQIGMDKLLNAFTHPSIASQSRSPVAAGVVEDRSDVTQADKLEQLERRDAARYRYERMYWESTPEDGREPLLPGVLEAAKKRTQLKDAATKAKANRMLPTHPPKSPWMQRPQHSFVAWRRGGVATRFVDAGAEFLDVDALLKSRASKRHKLQQRKAYENKLQVLSK
ncbi:hypothetical protein GALMADRAFT_218678 [Galerina marginata CBS 339.88]|uniref:Uncharacterized protein n=1 Tax=Galerina marginata (strain CBS 339.88) TaxID=685588 RepID=A0A067TTD3_GALM3|nr:hypothetical protein GALMADRAFT_218678 [Galerina marginata CBS 339.88]